MKVLFMRVSLFCLLFYFTPYTLLSQAQNKVITAADSFLTIASDARASGMGDVGIASAPDAFSMQWNPAKYVFSEYSKGIGLGYTPFLDRIIQDIVLLSGTYFKKPTERSAFAIGLRYFTLGDVKLLELPTDPGIIVKPNEFALDGSFALKLSPYFSMAVSGRYIRSNLKIPQEGGIDSKAASTAAVDLSAFYMGELKAYPAFNGRWRWGANLSNLGPKIAYDASGQEDFLPANLGLGLGYDFVYSTSSVLALQIDINKYLVPIPVDYNQDGVIDQQDLNTYQSIDFLKGTIDSFSDTAGGFSEELKELRIGLGLEYTLKQMFTLRTGYFFESEYIGSRRFFTLGTGVRLKALQIDMSYLFSTAKVRNPLENTLRFSLSFLMD
jgi:hypothetical protein|tara:strand:+ start:419 stop:1567 length:1149 start_codon:yes stop_codon:yes gene_type:complete